MCFDQSKVSQRRLDLSTHANFYLRPWIIFFNFIWWLLKSSFHKQSKILDGWKEIGRSIELVTKLNQSRESKLNESNNGHWKALLITTNIPNIFTTHNHYFVKPITIVLSPLRTRLKIFLVSKHPVNYLFSRFTIDLKLGALVNFCFANRS